MNSLRLLFKKFENSIIKIKSIINNLKIIESENNLQFSDKNYIIYKKKKLYNKEIKTGRFIDNNIVNFINNNLVYKVNYIYIYYGFKIEVNFICSKSNLITVDDKCKKIMLRIITFLDLNKNIIKKKYVLINVYLTEFTKKFNNCILNKNRNIILGAKNVNTGFTDGISITLYRKEEILKVLVHELIHYFNIDKINRDINCYECKKKFNINNNTTIILNEGFVETWANLLNLLYILFENEIFNYNILNVPTNKNKITEYKNIFKKFENILKIEQIFALQQTAKILLNYNFDDYEEFLNNKHKIKSLKQGSSIFSYYIAKSIFLYNIDKFLKLYFNSKINQDLFIINYKKKDLINLLLTNSTNLDMIKIINNYMKTIKNKKICSESLSSLRMTFSPLSNF